jgi:hypothetical protein
MKRGTPDHPKTLALRQDLNLPIYSAVGLLELLWHFTAFYAPRGDIGRFSNQQIAAACGWDGDPDALVKAFISARWVDTNKRHRLIVHDWPEHADDAVHMALARRVTRFADGTVPNMRRLNKKEREELEPLFCAHTKRTPRALPRQSQSPAPPRQSPAAADAPVRTGDARARLRSVVTEFAQQQQRPVEDVLQEHSRTKSGAKMVNLAAIDRASDAWVDSTLSDAEKALARWNRDHAEEKRAQQEQQRQEILQAFYDEHGTTEAAETVLASMLDHPERTKDEGLNAWLDSVGVHESIRFEVRSVIWTYLCAAITRRKEAGEPIPPAWTRRPSLEAVNR